MRLDRAFTNGDRPYQRAKQTRHNCCYFQILISGGFETHRPTRANGGGWRGPCLKVELWLNFFQAKLVRRHGTRQVGIDCARNGWVI